MKENQSKLVAIARSNKKSDRMSLLYFCYGMPALILVSSLVVSSFFLNMLSQHFEDPSVNQALYCMGMIFMAIALNRHFISYKDILGSVLLVYEDRIVAKNRFTRTSIPREGNIRFLRSPIFQTTRIESGGKKYLVPSFGMGSEFQSRLAENGIKIEKSFYFELLVGTCIVLYGLCTQVLPRAQVLSEDTGLLLFLGMAIFFALLNSKKNPAKPTGKKGFFSRIFLSKYSFQSVGFLALMVVCTNMSGKPLNSLDQKIHSIHALTADGQYAEAKKLYEELDSPERKPVFKNNYAWFLSVVPKSEFRNPEKAVRLAGDAYVLTKNKTTADTYSCALMASGNRESAMKLATEHKLKKRIEAFNEGALCTDQSFGARSIASVKE